MGRSNYTSPRYVDRIDALLSEGGVDREDIVMELRRMTTRHDTLLQELYRMIDNYELLLQEHGPHHQVELGEPLSRFANILRKAMNSE